MPDFFSEQCECNMWIELSDLMIVEWWSVDKYEIDKVPIKNGELPRGYLSLCWFI
jgi:hypothetical protein